ncbi:hypothetical protein FB451DRAFT_1164105 [Mycena latifolia]|nr:hypothetical protein FB451DRAFT_1164105 [Mycena latifolia]
MPDKNSATGSGVEIGDCSTLRVGKESWRGGVPEQVGEEGMTVPSNVMDRLARVAQYLAKNSRQRSVARGHVVLRAISATVASSKSIPTRERIDIRARKTRRENTVELMYPILQFGALHGQSREEQKSGGGGGGRLRYSGTEQVVDVVEIVMLVPPMRHTRELFPNRMFVWAEVVAMADIECKIVERRARSGRDGKVSPSGPPRVSVFQQANRIEVGTVRPTSSDIFKHWYICVRGIQESWMVAQEETSSTVSSVEVSYDIACTQLSDQFKLFNDCSPIQAFIAVVSLSEE